MRKLIKLMVAVFLVLCLPLQGVAGLTMPACIDQQPVSMQMADDHAAMDSHCEQMKMAMEKKAHDHKMSHDKCAACYITVAQAIVPQVKLAVPALADMAYPAMSLSNYQTLLSPPYYPPRSTSALG